MNRWESQTSSPTVPKSGDKVISSIEHLSWYGIGGTPIATSTPALSTWSLAIEGIVALGLVLAFRRRSILSA